MGQHPGACPCTRFLPGEPTASCLPTELAGTHRGDGSLGTSREMCDFADVSS